MNTLRKLYRGETNFRFIQTRKSWYLASLVLVVICIASIAFRGFNFGIDFSGGTQFLVPSSSSVTTSSVDDAFKAADITSATPAQTVGSGSTEQVRVRTGDLSVSEQSTIKVTLAKSLGITNPADINIQSVGSDWGHDVTVKAIQGLIVFLIVVSIYIAIRFQWRMAVGGIAALLHDLLIAAGIYSIVGFEVTPGTIVGLLTILGFSLYDTVVVYDKVAENAKDLLAGSRMTYGEAANLAVNQTLMRSINTSLIGLLPVAGLLFVGVGLLGVGTIKDLALILFVGLASGAYSSLFLATPIVVDLTEATPEYRALTKRVTAKRASLAKREADNADLVAAGQSPVPVARRGSGGGAPAPRPGARPGSRSRPQQRRKR